MGCASRQAEAPSAARNETIKGLNRGDFVGAWRLVSWTSTAGGRTNFPFDADAKGLLVYTADGQMSVFLSRSNRSAFARPESNAGTADEKVAAFDSCFAYAGTFPVVEGRVMHRLEHCTFPNWIGTEQVRFVRFEGDRLILETPPLPSGSGNAVSRLVWERARP
jgi:hypothetical protein